MTLQILCGRYLDTLTLFEALVISRYTMGNFFFIDEDFRFVDMWTTVCLMPMEWSTLFINLLLTKQILATTAFFEQSFHPEDWRVWPRTKFLVNILRGFRCFNTYEYLLGSVSCDIARNSSTDLDKMAKNFQTIWAPMVKQHNFSATTACMYFMFHLVFNLFSPHGKDTQRY